MKPTYLLICVLFSLLLFSCDSTSKVTNKETTKTIKETPKTTSASSAYETVVLKSDIASPRKEMRGKLGDIAITINYGSPSAKGRDLWGGLVPTDKVWRTGANEATTIEFSKAVKIEGKELPAGKYGLFTIYNDNSSTIIFNKTHDQWGAYKYDESEDALRVKATAKTVSEFSEAMEFAMEDSAIVLMWGKKALEFQVQA